VTASGRTDLLGKIADRWDRIPVEGPAMIAATTILGLGLALSGGGFSRGDCQHHPLRRVYNPKRLTVIQKCAEATGTVVAWRREHDGDYHVNMRLEGDWVNAANVRGQHGNTVVEFVPRDPKPKRFFAGQRLHLQGTKVYDEQHKRKAEQHGWIELHPVFKAEDVTPQGPLVTPRLPNQPALAPPTEEP
jgi:hypothetical protein